MDLPLGYSCYCIDTSALVDLKNWHWREVFDSLWKDIEKLISEGRLFSPREVLSELEPKADKQDELLLWAKRHRSMFLDLDDDQTAIAHGIISRFRDLVDSCSTIPEADPFVIALAKSKGWTVVTQEKTARPGKKPKVPDVCYHYKIKVVGLKEFFIEQGWKY